MGRLLIFPEIPSNKSGYQIAVKSDFSRLKVQEDDTVLFYTLNPKYDTYKTIQKYSKYSYKRIVNIVRGRLSSELFAEDLKRILKKTQFESIFCGDIIVYNAVKKLFPDAELSVRFHNFFTVCLIRKQFLNYKWNLLSQLNLVGASNLEKKILNDPKVFPIFITEEEAQFFKTIYPDRKHLVWSIINGAITPAASKTPKSLKLVWFGGISSHKKPGIIYFIKNIYPRLQKVNKGFEFHLFGSGTKSFDQPAQNIFGHGFYEPEGMPFNGEALFINPDLIGGGIKLKINDILIENIPMISTSFGLEGYEYKNMDNIVVAGMENWEKEIIHYFRRKNLL